MNGGIGVSKKILCSTVDGRNPAPVDMVSKYPIVYRGFYAFQEMYRISSINSTERFGGIVLRFSKHILA